MKLVPIPIPIFMGHGGGGGGHHHHHHTEVIPIYLPKMKSAPHVINVYGGHGKYQGWLVWKLLFMLFLPQVVMEEGEVMEDTEEVVAMVFKSLF